MKRASIAFATVLIFSTAFAHAQSQAPGGRGSTSGDPAASSASDANGDRGRDKMPDSSQGVRPLTKQNKM
jgi:hypothetical protein